MDPHHTYCDILAAINAADLETVRELALALRQWLDRGGFYPPGQVPSSVDALLQSVLACTDGSEPDMPFTLVCQECDAGEEACSLTEAILLGKGMVR